MDIHTYRSPTRSPQNVRIVAPPPTPTVRASTERNPVGLIIASLLMLSLGGVGGYWGHQLIDNQASLLRYASELEPLVYYKDRLHAGGERGSNMTMRIVNFKVHQAHQDGISIENLLTTAQPRHKQPLGLAKLTTARLISNLELGENYGMYEGADNLKALAYGRAPYATKGEYKGQRMDVEHIVPRSIAPSLDNILANLMWLPAPLNQSKSATITPEAMQMAEVFHHEGILPLDEFEAVRKAYRSVSR